MLTARSRSERAARRESLKEYAAAVTLDVATKDHGMNLVTRDGFDVEDVGEWECGIFIGDFFFQIWSIDFVKCVIEKTEHIYQALMKSSYYRNTQVDVVCKEGYDIYFPIVHCANQDCDAAVIIIEKNSEIGENDLRIKTDGFSISAKRFPSFYRQLLAHKESN